MMSKLQKTKYTSSAYSTITRSTSSYLVSLFCFGSGDDGEVWGGGRQEKRWAKEGIMTDTQGEIEICR